MLKSGAAIALVGALACAACVEDDAAVSPYAANYKPLVTPTAAEKFAGEPQLRSSLGSSADDTLAMFTLGYANVGWASYQGQADDPEAALDQARAIGAAYVVI